MSAALFTCLSCRVAFDAAPEQRAHFATDWHRYNMKRRVANLLPISAATFNDKVTERHEQNAVRLNASELSCKCCSKSFGTDNSFRSHLESKRHQINLAKQQRHRPEQHTDQSVHQAVGQVANRMQDDDEMSGEEGNDITERIAASRRRARPTDCLFCNHRSRSIPEVVDHMKSVHSFHVPHAEELVDLEGLLSYLGEKVQVGNLCLYCPNGGREFASVEAVRRHMVDKSHCKVAFETDEDLTELADFYHYHSGVNSDWEDTDSEMDDQTQAVGLDAGNDILDVSPRNRHSEDSVRLGDDGFSLRLPSGRTIGHKALRVYYRQRPRSAHAASPKIQGSKHSSSVGGSDLVPLAGGSGAFGRGLQVVRARNSGEAKWAKKQARSFKEQKAGSAQRLRVAMVHNNQKHFRDPLLQ